MDALQLNAIMHSKRFILRAHQRRTFAFLHCIHYLLPLFEWLSVIYFLIRSIIFPFHFEFKLVAWRYFQHTEKQNGNVFLSLDYNIEQLIRRLDTQTKADQRHRQKRKIVDAQECLLACICSCEFSAREHAYNICSRWIQFAWSRNRFNWTITSLTIMSSTADWTDSDSDVCSQKVKQKAQ